MPDNTLPKGGYALLVKGTIKLLVTAVGLNDDRLPKYVGDAVTGTIDGYLEGEFMLVELKVGTAVVNDGVAVYMLDTAVGQTVVLGKNLCVGKNDGLTEIGELEFGVVGCHVRLTFDGTFDGAQVGIGNEYVGGALLDVG